MSVQVALPRGPLGVQGYAVQALISARHSSFMFSALVVENHLQVCKASSIYKPGLVLRVLNPKPCLKAGGS